MKSTVEIRKHLEAAGHQAAIEYMEAVAKQHIPLGQVELLEMHRRLFAQSWPEIAGRFRNENVEIADTSYLPPHWSQATPLMYQMLSALNYRLLQIGINDVSEIIRTAAQAHYDLAAIHPFRDGNGRIARLILNYVFRYFDLPYVVIPLELRTRYLDTLEVANRGEMTPFIDLVAECYEHSLDQMTSSQPFG